MNMEVVAAVVQGTAEGTGSLLCIGHAASDAVRKFALMIKKLFL